MSPGFKRVIFLISGSVPLAPGHWRTCAGFPPAEVGPGQRLGPPRRDGWFPACRDGPVGLCCGQSVWVPWRRRSVLAARPGVDCSCPHLPGAVSAGSGATLAGRRPACAAPSGRRPRRARRHGTCWSTPPGPPGHDAARSALPGHRPARPGHDAAKTATTAPAVMAGAALAVCLANRRRGRSAQPPADRAPPTARRYSCRWSG